MSVAAQLESVLRPALRGPLPVRLAAWDGSVAGPSDAPTVIVRSPYALRRVLWHPGELGAAQAYVTGELDVDGDFGAALNAVWRVVTQRALPGVRPRDVARLAAAAARLGAIGRPLPAPDTQVSLRGRRNTRRRDRAAISHHYDASNDFYTLLLGPVMAYSCAYYTGDAPAGPEQAESALAEAQLDKLDMVCRKLDLAPGMRLLDVGCGWGALALHAAEHYDVDVVGLTISREQQRHLELEAAARDLTGRVQARLLDYRDLTVDGFDAVASLEMGEHVGRRNYPRYAQTLRDAAAPGAPVLIQQMSRHGRHPGGGPFIESFIAPDMAMRPIGDTLGMLEAGGLEVRDVQAMREHYVWTAWAWLHRLERQWDQAVSLLGGQGARTWRLYLAGGALAFEHGRMGVDQIVLRRSSPARSRSRSVSRTAQAR